MIYLYQNYCLLTAPVMVELSRRIDPLISIVLKSNSTSLSATRLVIKARQSKTQEALAQIEGKIPGNDDSMD